jgi:hypothetical protein
MRLRLDGGGGPPGDEVGHGRCASGPYVLRSTVYALRSTLYEGSMEMADDWMLDAGCSVLNAGLDGVEVA